jgi:hypothetical protein
VGIDAHKKDLFIAMLIGQEKTPVTWQLANEPQAVRRLVRKLERDAPGPVSIFYEAGPCGCALQRQVTTSRVRCEVIAPALIPRKRPSPPCSGLDGGVVTPDFQRSDRDVSVWRARTRTLAALRGRAVPSLLSQCRDRCLTQAAPLSFGLLCRFGHD